MTVRIQTQDFDTGAELTALRLARPDIGAVASFIGQMRDVNDGSAVSSMTLEHYQGMTDKALQEIEARAKSRWDIFDTLIIHRIGTLKPTDQIVLVAVSSSHRGEAFAACEFIMDFLKTSAPFWKKETTPQGERWVEAKISDDEAKARWLHETEMKEKLARADEWVRNNPPQETNLEELEKRNHPGALRHPSLKRRG